ncbi:hypothetical protein [Saccharibacillus qingshengii]|uniref:hypothetical protein n=1 Tax=Saccharibacillus qingshengii TaxID=1763540 RepID=UPI0015545788|nr:hypothetical protein [Saccharibacillus qingshengii]
MIRRKWRKRAKWKTLLLGLVGMIMLTGCTVRESMAEQQIYGSNELIAQSGDRYSFDFREGTIEEGTAAFDFGQFTGKQTLWTVDAPEAAQVTLELALGIDNGKCKVVHILPGGDVVKLADAGAEADGEPIILDLPKGENVIKLIGKKAYGTVRAEFADTEAVTIRSAAIETDSAH